MENLLAQIPAYARDVKINLQNILTQENQFLSNKQIAGSALAAAYGAKEKSLIKALENHAQNILSESEISAVKTAASLMAMNNIYYRFTHIAHDNDYAQMPVGLRMQGIANHGIDKIDFEIFSLAVSILNGCAMCIDAHANQLLKHELTKSHVQMIAKIAAIINSASTALTIENN
jgi:alkyl hydroperoxide reductase subunit D